MLNDQSSTLKICLWETMLGRLRHIFRIGIHGRVHTTHIGSVAITEFHTVTVFFFIVWSPTLVLGDIDRLGTLFDEGTILDSQGAVAFKQLSAYDIPSSVCIKRHGGRGTYLLAVYRFSYILLFPSTTDLSSSPPPGESS